ncbi:hypothetical protein BM525_20360 (plasmid) [Alteromonas mediterranea]|uniref:Uncharacterized protein n=1 Tax=Alteromonas mediterranea TaxID=314275 RepID=A0AAC9JI24_9ALTE|nr:hypothetical protein [Alteromonas mediterranea]APD92233.1 hypothetical protein BM524_20165 [Alteromonas mediterranea]APE00088.1 hypothetical protein BM525_20360 [Alteromonas mediterranea]
MTLEEIFTNYPVTLGRESFSKFLYDEHHTINITVHIDNFEEFYLKAKELLEASASPLRDNELDFVDRGLDFSERARHAGNTNLDLTGNAAYMLTRIYERDSYPLPEWVPQVFFISSKPGSKHRKEYLFMWNTVSPHHLPASKEGVFISAVKRFARRHEIDGEVNPIKPTANAAKGNGAASTTAPLLPDNPDLVGLKQLQKWIKTDCIPTAAFNPKSVGNSLFVDADASPSNQNFNSSMLAIMLYSSLISECHEQNIPMTLTISDVHELIETQDTCAYTDVKLDKGPKSSISDDHFCLARKSECSVYSKENTVACSSKAKRIITSFSGKQRDDALTAIKMINSSGISMEMLMSLSNV